VIDGGEREAIALDGVGRDRGRVLEAVAVAAAEDVDGDAELVAAEIGLRQSIVS
jgi:hypothetical protein